MQWNQSTMYEQRVRFILEVQQGTFSFESHRDHRRPIDLSVSSFAGVCSSR